MGHEVSRPLSLRHSEGGAFEIDSEGCEVQQ